MGFTEFLETLSSPWWYGTIFVAVLIGWALSKFLDTFLGKFVLSRKEHSNRKKLLHEAKITWYANNPSERVPYILSGLGAMLTANFVMLASMFFAPWLPGGFLPMLLLMALRIGAFVVALQLHSLGFDRVAVGWWATFNRPPDDWQKYRKELDQQKSVNDSQKDNIAG